MKVKSTVFDLELSGALGNVVAGIAKGGVRWLRSRVTPSNPQTTPQSAVRAALSSLAAHWRDTLSQAERDAWDDYALTATKNGLTLSGQSWFVGGNALRAMVNANLPATLTAAVIEAGPTSPGRALLSPCSISVDAVAGDLEITFNAADPWNTAVDGGLIVMANGPASPSRIFNNEGVRFNSFLEGAVVPPTSPQTISGAFLPGAVGDRYFVELRAILPDGRYSEPQRFNVLGT